MRQRELERHVEHKRQSDHGSIRITAVIILYKFLSNSESILTGDDVDIWHLVLIPLLK
jgi:hypothetical protein